MKVTAIIPDLLIEDVKKYSKGKNITDSLIIALKEWISIKHLRELNNRIEKEPLEFAVSASELRDLNRS